MRSRPSSSITWLLVVLGLVVATGVSFVLSLLGQAFLAAVAGLLVGGVAAAAIVRKPIWGIYALVFLLPFERIGSVEIGSFTLRMSQIVALVSLFAYLWQRLLSKKFSFQRNPIALPVLVFLCANLLSLFGAINLTRGVQVFLFTLFVILVSLLIPQVVVRKRHIQKVLWALFLSAFAVSLFGVFQFIGDLIGLSPSITGLSSLYTKDVFGFPRVQSTALEPLYFANYLLVPLSIAISFILAKLPTKNTGLWIGLTMLLGVNLVMTLSRGGYLGLVAVVVILAVLNWRRVFTKKNTAIFASIIAVAAIAASFLLGLSDNARQSVDTFTKQALNFNEGASILERQGTITDAMEAFKGNPVFGIGPGNFGPYVARNPLKTPERGWLIVNNETVELLAETGVVGLLSFVVVVVVLLVSSFRAYLACKDPWTKAVLAGVLAGVLGVMVQYQTFSTLFIMHVWVFVGLLVALQNIARQESGRKGEKSD